MRNPVRPSSCVTPAGTSNELDVQNGWEENTHTHTQNYLLLRKLEINRSIRPCPRNSFKQVPSREESMTVVLTKKYLFDEIRHSLVPLQPSSVLRSPLLIAVGVNTLVTLVS